MTEMARETRLGWLVMWHDLQVQRLPSQVCCRRVTILALPICCDPDSFKKSLFLPN